MDNNISNSEKNNLIEAVKEWIDYDMKLEILNKKVKEIKNAKAILNSQMNLIMKQHNIDILDTKNGQIQRKKIKRKEQLSQKKLLNILSKYPGFTSNEVGEINKFVYDNRTIIEKETITRKTL